MTDNEQSVSSVKRPPLWSPSTLIATVFGIGYIRPAPGTWGSLAGLLTAALALYLFPDGAPLESSIFIMIAVGIVASGHYARAKGEHDASEIVIDEVAGQWIVLLPLSAFGIGVNSPMTVVIPVFIAAFLLFRFFDILKPWPISWADRKIGGGFGVMFDDILAGLAAAGVLYAFLYWRAACAAAPSIGCGVFSLFGVGT